MKPKLNLRQIEAFRAVMRTGTVVAAADTLNVSQPAVSRLISQMEMRLGFPLFERKGRRLMPSSQGEKLFREVERVYVGVERIAQAAVDIKHHRTGELRVASMPGLSMWILPRAVRRFHELHPGVYLFVNSVLSRQISELVGIREIDVGVVELPVLDPAVDVYPIDSQPAVLLVHQNHRFAGRPRVSLGELGPETLILLSQHSALRLALEQAFYQLKVAPNIAFETPHSLIACAMVREALGAAIVSNQTAKQFDGRGMHVIELEERITLDFGVVLPKIGARNPLSEVFVECLRQEFLAS